MEKGINMGRGKQSDGRKKTNERKKEETFIINYYYLFKKFLVSDWLTANCEIVISTQWPTKYGFFAFILAK